MKKGVLEIKKDSKIFFSIYVARTLIALIETTNLHSFLKNHNFHLFLHFQFDLFHRPKERIWTNVKRLPPFRYRLVIVSRLPASIKAWFSLES